MLRTGLAKGGTTDASTKNPEANLEENPEKTRSAIAMANENATQMSKVAAVAEAPCETEDSLDRLLHAREARFTFSQSLKSLTLAFLDWGLHLANAPGRRITLAESASRQWARLLSQDLWAKPPAGDHRFDDESWAHPPFNTFAQATILAEQWWNEATACLPGVAKSHSAVVSFAARQILDLYSPSNFPLTNPEVLRATSAKIRLEFYQGLSEFQRGRAAGRAGPSYGRSQRLQGRRRSCGDARQGGVPQ